ncbi:hypothetical protein EXU48_10425 [Occultella glacieicola]|uniref:PASTA domain-containing protein n=1 Tax=Occultella glacieicola TaxID=2518684 RepID=A0ABY2E451_9MICO|nr:hypothetical protein [Occultella glacieicola]TDE93885.1 hypothetical protein EXU48_10425 [Occultella glacieicola]
MNPMLKKVLVLTGATVVLVLGAVVAMTVWGDQLVDTLPSSARRARRYLWLVIPVLVALVGTLLRGPITRWILKDGSDTRDSGIAVGRVVSVSRTGMSVNDVPQRRFELDVETPEGTRFRSRATQLVPEHELGRYRPGTLVPVRHRPGRTKSVSLVTDSPAAARAALADHLVARGLTTPEQLDVSSRGVRTHAVLTAATPTGQVRDAHTQLRLALVVTRPDGSQYPASQELYVPRNALPHLRVGARVAAFVLPEDERRVSVGLAV